MRDVSALSVLLCATGAHGCSFLVTSLPPVKLAHGALDAANAMQKRRGPDRTNIARVHGVTFVHNLLYMTGSPTTQPFVAPDKSVTAIFNGELYNWRELDLPSSVQLASDGHALLPLYASDGPAFISRLRGEFAIVVVDHRRGIVLLATDTFGTKPLWVGQSHAEGASRRSAFGLASYASALRTLGLTRGLRQVDSNTVEVRRLRDFSRVVDTRVVHRFDLRQHIRVRVKVSLV